VTDTGVGIPPEQQAVIFEAFYTAGDGMSQQGSGLGLAIARRLVELHTGRIWVQSRSEKAAPFAWRCRRWKRRTLRRRDRAKRPA